MRILRRSEALTLLCCGAVLFAWAWVAMATLRSDPQRPIGVMGDYWTSGNAANHGLDPYAGYPMQPPAFPPDLRPAGAPADERDKNLNPPALLPIYQLMALVQPDIMLEIWMLGSAAVMIATATCLIKTTAKPVSPWKILCVLFMTPSRESIWMAQNYAFLFMLAGLGWIALRHNRVVLAAVAIGAVAAMKPNFLLWPAFLFVIGQRRIAVGAGVVFAALCMLPILIDGPGVYHQWSAAVSVDQHWRYPNDISLPALLHRLGYAPWGAGASILVVAFTTSFVARTRPDVSRTSVIALCASILAAPLAWNYYFLTLVPAFIDGLWGPAAPIAAALMMLPGRYSNATMMQPPLVMVAGTMIGLVPLCIILAQAIVSGRRTEHVQLR